MSESVGNADLLSDHFDIKQSKESVYLHLTRHPSPSLTTFAFKSSEVRRLLLNLGRLPDLNTVYHQYQKNIVYRIYIRH